MTDPEQPPAQPPPEPTPAPAAPPPEVVLETVAVPALAAPPAVPHGPPVLPVGELVSRVFQAWAANGLRLGAVMLALSLPFHFALPALALPPARSNAPPWALYLHWQTYAEYVLTHLQQAVYGGAVTIGTAAWLEGGRASVRGMLTGALRRIPVTFPVVLGSSLAIAIAATCLVIPGIAVAMMLAVALPVAVLEPRGAAGSFSRSSDLTADHRWRLLAVVGIPWLVAGSAAGLAVWATREDLAAQRLAILAITVTFGCLNQVAPVVAYRALRTLKEGTPAEHLARVFE